MGSVSRFFEEYVYLIALAVGLALVIKGTWANAKVVSGLPFIPDGLRAFMAS